MKRGLEHDKYEINATCPSLGGNFIKTKNIRCVFVCLIICSISLVLTGCGAKLSTKKDVEKYVKRIYGKEYTLTLIGDFRQERKWEVNLKDKNIEVTFELRNFLRPSIQFLDNTSFGPIKEYYQSTYAIEKAKIVHDNVLKIVRRYPDIEYIEDAVEKSDRFIVHNNNYKDFIKCIKEIDKLYSFPIDTYYLFFATVYDDENNVADSWLYSYSIGDKKLDESLLQPKN